jgi:hypothetical protein
MCPDKNWPSTMPRPRHRACLQDGLKLDLNQLARKGFIKFGANIGIRGITWSNSYWGEIASGLITADMSHPDRGWFEISIGGFRQRITLVSRSRHFGGRQWFFQCPATHRLATVLWKPPGADRFCSRQTWGRQVAYRSQFLDRDNRAHAGKERIRARLIGDLDPDEWDLPPKPKWMRWKTYNRHEEKFGRYEEILDYGCAALAAKLTGLKIF